VTLEAPLWSRVWVVASILDLQVTFEEGRLDILLVSQEDKSRVAVGNIR